ncbi:MAG: radical SAM protein [Myxococcales bacterium]|nr:radical SAM protein [Myxococcales bacterium]
MTDAPPQNRMDRREGNPTELLAAMANNQWRIARLSARYGNFAKTIFLRRLYETIAARSVAGARAVSRRTPIEIVAAVSSACQLSCRMCGIRQVMQEPPYRGARLSYDDLAPAFREIETWSPRPYVKFTGGEPLLLGDELFRMLDACRRRRIPTRLSTNGLLLADRDLARELVGTGVDVVTISLDGPPEVHDAVRGQKDAFARTLAGIGNLAAARQAIGRRGPLIQISSVIQALNAGRLRETYGLCRGLPIDWWNVQLLNFLTPDAAVAADHLAQKWGYAPGPWGAFVRDELRHFDHAALAESVAWIKRRISPFAISFHRIGGFDAAALRNYYANGELPRQKKLCAAPFISLHLAPNGDFVYCIDYPYIAYGNVRTHSLRDAWRSAAADRFRGLVLDEFRRTGRTPPQCARCNWMYN